MKKKQPNPKRTGLHLPPPEGKHKGVAELTDTELIHVTGGAYEAYIKISATKQGQAKGGG